MPVGNGRMGSLVWTSPTQLKLQINRVDVFAADGRTVSFPEADSDFAGGCGYVDISLVSAGQDVTLYRNGKKAEDLSGAILTFPTGQGETIVAVPKGSEPARVKVL